MTHETINRTLAIGVFLVAVTVYFLTMAPTVVFWDVGEFIAGAFMLQVPHPPGSPLFLLLTRLAMMIPFPPDPAVRAHALSAIFSAVGIMFLYLVTVKVLLRLRARPETLVDRVILYGSAVVGSLALAFSTSYWDNSLEAEVYGASMFFLGAILWLILRWEERSEHPRNEKYLLLIAYLIGLSLGVHLLALLAIFPVLMVIYFRKYEFTWSSFLLFLGVVAPVIFWIVYPGIVKTLPSMLGGTTGVWYVPVLLAVAAAYGVWYFHRERKPVWHTALLALLLILLGYSTYTSVLIRSNANPPMNENDPSDLQRLTAYLGREQYGQAPLFMPRRYSQEPHQTGMYSNYTSEWDFLWRYQLNHMYTRYLLWNFVGQGGNYQDAGWSAKETLGIPFALGLFGLYTVFRRNWKLGLVLLTAFVVLGPVLALFQNQQEPQPRERDYFYVGSFFVFALWIAVAVAELAALAQEWIARGKSGWWPAAAVVGLALLAVPGNALRANWHEKDRSGNYVAWDYSYNILQSCEKDAILFTNGDNDTFPLWYLQDVEGVRRDVRIVNLSLVNTPWYIKQMKAAPYYAEAKAVPMSIPDDQIERIQPTMWEPRPMRLPVPQDIFARYGVTDTAITNRGGIDFLMRNTLEIQGTKAIRVQDIMVRDIIFTNRWDRPVYFAVTVAPDSKIGLDEYLWFNGLAWRLEPRRVSNADLGLLPEILEKNLFDEPEGFSRTPQYGYKFRRLSDPSVHFDENQSRLMINYRSAFMRMAEYFSSVRREPAKAIAALDRMEQLIPRAKVPMGWEVQYIVATFYNRLGRSDRYNELAAEVQTATEELVRAGDYNATAYGYSPAAVLLEIYETQGNWAAAVDVWRQLSAAFPGDPTVTQRLAAAEARLRQQGASTPHDTTRRNLP
jgi:hypothetical protein